MESIHAELASVTLYLEMFEKMHHVMSIDQDRPQLCRARSRAVLSDLLKMLSATERRLNTGNHPTLETEDWIFHFEAMIAPLWSSVMDVKSTEDASALECRVRRASVFILACLPLLRSHQYTLEEAIYSDPYFEAPVVEPADGGLRGMLRRCVWHR